ncbi:MAG TPA: Flp family type IVb pilin [Vicinamibacterales bacterium]|jgi:Flp pilus assembly pilin Flp|nr:Flp family type IVb pilin [Vicinamibacterales bacterium]
MSRLWRVVAEFSARCDGQDLIEYGLLAALIAVIAVAAMTAVGTTLNSVFYNTFPSAI